MIFQSFIMKKVWKSTCWAVSIKNFTNVREEKTDSIKSTRNGIKSAFRSITSFWNNSGKKRNFLWLSFQNCLFILKQVLNQSKLHKSEKNCFDGHFKLGFVLKGDILWKWFMAFLQHFVLTEIIPESGILLEKASTSSDF